MKMLINDHTVKVLSNFQTINPGIHIKPGKILQTMSPVETIVAQAEVPFEFPKEFVLADLSRFLSILSLSKENNLEFEDTQVLIHQASSTAKISYSSLDIVFPSGDVKFPEPPYIEFVLSWDILQATTKAMQIMKFNEIKFVGKDGKIWVIASNSKRPNDDTYTTVIGDTDKKFSCVVELEKLKILQSDYFVRISDIGLIHMKGDMAQYWLAASEKSEFA